MDENEDKAWWRPKSSHVYSHLQPDCRSQWYLCAALCVTLTLSLSLIILMPSHFGSVDRKVSDLERSVSNLTESVSFHLSKLHEKVGSLEMKLSDLKRSVSNRTESVSFHSAKLPKKGVVGCTDGWTLQNSNCYFFSAFTASWYTARDFCRSMDATLLTLTDEEEWGFVNRMRAGSTFWLGLSDERTGEWEWVNGSPYIMDQSKWSPGQPDNWTGHSVGGTEDCAHFTTGGKLNDNHCTVTYKFICKATLAPN